MTQSPPQPYRQQQDQPQQTSAEGPAATPIFTALLAEYDTEGPGPITLSGAAD